VIPNVSGIFDKVTCGGREKHGLAKKNSNDNNEW